MKTLLPLFFFMIFLALSGCNSCSDKAERKYEVMRLYGGWKARADETLATVQRIEDHYREYTQYDFDSLEISNYSTEYPYWKEVRTYVDDTGLRLAHVLGKGKKGRRAEKFYFDKGALVFARIINGEGATISFEEMEGQQYFFVKNTLVLALDENGERRDIEDKKIMLAGIDLLNESRQIKAIIAKRDIQY